MSFGSLCRWSRPIAMVLGVVAFGLVVASADVRGTAAILMATGPILVLAAVPYAVQIGFDALAWRTLFRTLGRRLRWRRLFAIRLATEALLMSLPGGALVGETMKPYLALRTDRVPPAETIATLGLKKCLLALAEALCLGAAAILGGSFLSSSSRALIGVGGLPWLVAAAAVGLALVASTLALTMLGGSTADAVHRALLRVPFTGFRSWLSRRRAPFAATDAALRRFGQAPQTLAAALACLLAAWMTEIAETWLLLRLLGSDVGLATVWTMESIVVLLRNVAFFVPAGLGVQDAGYVAFLRALGIAYAGEAAAAFVIVKRGKELLWVAIGYLVLRALTRAHPSQLPEPDQENAT
jgi:uncharacterized membrane protein YbhN (UPF0104 family)